MINFYDKKPLFLATSKYGLQNYKYYNKRKKLKLKPEIVCIYNLTKSGVDLADMEIQNYKTQSRTKNRWKALFSYILDVTLKNLSIIYFVHEQIKKEKEIWF